MVTQNIIPLQYPKLRVLSLVNRQAVYTMDYCALSIQRNQNIVFLVNLFYYDYIGGYMPHSK